MKQKNVSIFSKKTGEKFNLAKILETFIFKHKHLLIIQYFPCFKKIDEELNFIVNILLHYEVMQF